MSVRLTQEGLQAVFAPQTTNVRLTQEGLQVVFAADSRVRLTQIGLQVVYSIHVNGGKANPSLVG